MDSVAGFRRTPDPKTIERCRALAEKIVRASFVEVSETKAVAKF